MDFLFCLIAYLSIKHGVKNEGLFYKFYSSIFNFKNNKKFLGVDTILTKKSIFFILIYTAIASQCALNFPIYVNFILTFLFSLCTCFSRFNIFYKKNNHIERFICLVFTFLSLYDISFIGILAAFNLFFCKIKYFKADVGRSIVDSEWSQELSVLLPNLFICSGIINLITFYKFSLTAESLCYSILSIGALYYHKAGLGKPHPKKNNSVWSLLPAAEIQWDWFSRYPYKLFLKPLKFLSKKFNKESLYLVYFIEVYYIFFACSGGTILLFSSLGALLHIAIFILTGINFWKWTLINLFVAGISFSTNLNCGIEGLLLTYFLYKIHYKNVIGLHWFDPHVACSNAIYFVCEGGEKIRLHPTHLSGPINGLELIQFNAKVNPILKSSNYLCRKFGALGIAQDQELYNKTNSIKDVDQFKKSFKKQNNFNESLRSKYIKIINSYIKNKKHFFIWNCIFREPTHVWVGYKYKSIKNKKVLHTEIHHKFYLSSRDSTSNHILVDQFIEKL